MTDAGLLYRSTRDFEEDLRGLPPLDRSRVVATINELGTLYATDRRGFYRRARRLRPVVLSDALDSSLYMARIGSLRLIYAAEEDPAFNQLVITLFRIASRSTIYDDWESTVKQLYGDRTKSGKGQTWPG